MQRIETLHAADDVKDVEVSVFWQSEAHETVNPDDRITLFLQRGEDLTSIHITAFEADLIGAALVRAAEMDTEQSVQSYIANLNPEDE